MRIGIIAALPGELKPLVRGWERLPVVKGSGITIWRRPETVRGHQVLAACGGMGAAAARRAFAAVEFFGALDAALSVGWAGALTPDAKPGKCFEVSEVVDAQTGERFASGLPGVRLVTTARVADAHEKQRLANSYAATLVDMEAAAIARLGQMREIPVRCYKGVSDGLAAELPDLNPFINASGQLEMGRFLGHVALRPQYWGALATLGRHSDIAARAIAVEVKDYLQNTLGE
jgi:adenosylhomocysteine nucleosidase